MVNNPLILTSDWSGYHAGSVLAMDDDMAASGSGGGDAVIDMGGAVGGGQMMVTQDNDSYYASRADAMHTIEVILLSEWSM